MAIKHNRFNELGEGGLIMKKFRRGWEVQLRDGTVIHEGQIEWRKVPKKAITRLSLFYDGRQWSLTDKDSYFIKNRASMTPGVPESFRIESRTIGFYEGANKICYTINENNGKFEITVINNG